MKQIFIAKTVGEAKDIAISEFKVNPDRISFTILEEPKKSLFGKLKGEAKVQAEYEPNKVEITVEYLSKCLNQMGATDISIDVIDVENGALLDIKAKQTELVIGRKGETLDALQYLASLVCNRNEKEYFRISLDCGGYREKRKEQLENLAKKVAENVKKNGRSSSLESMNPYERRIVHAVLSEIEGVTSHSTGVEPHRRVIIASTEKRNDFKRDNKKPRGNRDNRSRKPRENKKSFDITTSFEKDYKKPKPEDNISSGLYSKIEF